MTTRQRLSSGADGPRKFEMRGMEAGVSFEFLAIWFHYAPSTSAMGALPRAGSVGLGSSALKNVKALTLEMAHRFFTLGEVVVRGNRYERPVGAGPLSGKVTPRHVS